MSVEALRARLTGQPTQEAQPRQLTEAQIEWMRAAETEEDRHRQREVAQAAAEAEYRQSFEGRTEVFREGQPPDDLLVKTAGLLPARAALVRYVAWLERERAELDRRVEARSRLLTALGAPEIAERDLNALKANDVTGLVSWAFDEAAGAFKVDEYRRAKAEEKLKEATAQAETARAALATVDEDIKFQEAVVRVLEGRRDQFVGAVLIEATGPLAQEFEATAVRLSEIGTQLGGAAHALRRRIDSIDRSLPAPGGLANARLAIDEQDMKRASGRWADLEKALRDDPRALLKDAG